MNKKKKKKEKKRNGKKRENFEIKKIQKNIKVNNKMKKVKNTDHHNNT